MSEAYAEIVRTTYWLIIGAASFGLFMVMVWAFNKLLDL